MTTARESQPKLNLEYAVVPESNDMKNDRNTKITQKPTVRVPGPIWGTLSMKINNDFIAMA